MKILDRAPPVPRRTPRSWQMVPYSAAQSHERTRTSRPHGHSGLPIQLPLLPLDPTKPSKYYRCLESHDGSFQTQRLLARLCSLLQSLLCYSLGSFFIIPQCLHIHLCKVNRRSISSLNGLQTCLLPTKGKGDTPRENTRTNPLP